MPIVTIEYQGERRTEVPEGTRLVHAIEGAGVDIGHRCGGYAKCTTCRVELLEGEPDKMTEAEAERLTRLEQEQGTTGVRLSCQVPVEGDMRVRPVMLQSEQGWPDPRPPPEPEITPEPVWTTKTAWRRR
ncbi:MAG TPA: 2Fe-2S iron-sulfur cluster-binding protein [Thermoanaerobaculia bacterium]|nr:2Fe-2S iron-sulfur cluster-binding protein [Thermoanaerobaculia bacterium]